MRLRRTGQLSGTKTTEADVLEGIGGTLVPPALRGQIRYRMQTGYRKANVTEKLHSFTSTMSHCFMRQSLTMT